MERITQFFVRHKTTDSVRSKVKTKKWITEKWLVPILCAIPGCLTPNFANNVDDINEQNMPLMNLDIRAHFGGGRVMTKPSLEGMMLD